MLYLASPLWGGYLLQRYVSGKTRDGWRQRWGDLAEIASSGAGVKPRIWIHAVSAGEVVAAVPIIREVRGLLPDFEILLSVITPAGMEMAEQQARPYTDHIFFFPFDFPWVVSRVVRHIHPRVFVSLESELWPNLLHELKRSGAKTVMVNGRISERSFKRSRRLAPALFRWMLSNMDRLLVQSEADAERIRILGGGLKDLNRVQVLGNSKFDQEITRLSRQEATELRRSLKFPDEAPIFVAGSTRSPEEEAEILSAYLKMRAAFPALCLLIAPRQIDRAGDIAEAMRRAGLTPVRKTELGAVETVRQLILDTMGELANVYAIAAFAFVGNSFPPVVKGGGQNLLQPLAHGKAVFFGPRHATIRSEAALSQQAGVGFLVETGDMLAKAGIRVLESESEQKNIEARALALIASQRGVSHRYAEAVAAMVE